MFPQVITLAAAICVFRTVLLKPVNELHLCQIHLTSTARLHIPPPDGISNTVSSCRGHVVLKEVQI